MLAWSHPRFRVSHLLFAFWTLFAAVAYGQGVLDKTDFGKSQNTAGDLENSLIPAKPNLTKGEKKGEVDPRTLQSKKMKDPLFQGGLMDVDVDWTGGKLGKPKVANESDSKVQKKAEATEDSKAAAKNPDPSREKDSKSSKSDAAEDPNKGQKQSSTKSGDKPSEKEKVAATKTDGDR